MERKSLRLSDLDFERDIRGTIAEVFGDHEDLISKVSVPERRLDAKWICPTANCLVSLMAQQKNASRVPSRTMCWQSFLVNEPICTRAIGRPTH